MALPIVFASIGATVGATLSSALAVMFVCLGWSYFKTWRRGKRRKSVTGKVVESSLEEKQVSGETRYFSKLVYEYEVDGKTYRDDQTSDINDSTQGSAQKPEKLAHELGDSVTVLYDPTDPKNAVLALEAGGCVLMAFIAATIFVGLATWCFSEALESPPAPKTIIIHGPEE